MATSVIKGKSGSCSLVALGLAVKVASFELNTGQDLVDVSAFGNTHHVFASCLKNLSGSVAGFLIKGTASAGAGVGATDAPASLTLTLDTGCTIAFDAILGNIKIQESVTGVATFMADIVNGSDTAPVETWVVS